MGRGGATNYQQDLANADCIVIEGSNMAEAHPVGFQWVIEAKARGAKVIHVDPRFTRTSAHADLYVPIRAGADITFLGAVVNYILSNEKDFREYVLAYTNASFIVSEGFKDTEDLDGLFSGYHTDTATYDQSTWQYEGMTEPPAEHSTGDHFGAGGPALHGEAPHPPSDPTLQHPRCVWQILKRHYSRYTPEMVEAICGIPQELFLEVCETWTANSGRERTTEMVYSVGWTQHTVGVQYIRTAAMSGARAAASWPCVGTRASRDRPTSPPSSTCCPPIFRCRTRPLIPI